MRSQDGGLTTCQTAVSVAQTWLYMKFHLSAAWSILQWHVNFLSQKHCCYLVSFINVSLSMIRCKSQHKELSMFCCYMRWFLSLLSSSHTSTSPVSSYYCLSFTFTFCVQLPWSKCRSLGRPASGLVGPELWEVFFIKKEKFVLVQLSGDLWHYCTSGGIRYLAISERDTSLMARTYQENE